MGSRVFLHDLSVTTPSKQSRVSFATERHSPHRKNAAARRAHELPNGNLLVGAPCNESPECGFGVYEVAPHGEDDGGDWAAPPPVAARLIVPPFDQIVRGGGGYRAAPWESLRGERAVRAARVWPTPAPIAPLAAAGGGRASAAAARTKTFAGLGGALALLTCGALAIAGRRFAAARQRPYGSLDESGPVERTLVSPTMAMSSAADDNADDYDDTAELKGLEL